MHYQVRLQYQYFHVQAHLRCLVRRCLPTLALCKNKKSQTEAVEMNKRRQLMPHDVYAEKEDSVELHTRGKMDILDQPSNE